MAAVCYVNHQLRPSADSEQALVADQCRKVGVPFTYALVDVPAGMQRDQLGIETAARLLRYKALREISGIHHASFIATGHTADDQVESVLMHEFRGSGLHGLGGMRELSGDIWRPLLTLKHSDAVSYCEMMQLPWLQDESNADRTTPRNRLRLDVLPVIDTAFPAARRALLNLAEIARQDDDYLRQAVTETMPYVTTGDAIIPTRWVALPAALRSRVILTWLEEQGQPANGAAVEATSRELLAAASPVSAWCYPGPLLAESLPSAVQNVGVPGVTRIGDLALEASVHTVTDDLITAAMLGANQLALLDRSAIRETVTIRSRRPGDRVRLLRSPGSRKLQDVFVDHKIPVGHRDRIPLIESDGEIIWVPGIGIAESAKVTAATTEVALFRFSSGRQVKSHST